MPIPCELRLRQILYQKYLPLLLENSKDQLGNFTGAVSEANYIDKAESYLTQTDLYAKAVKEIGADHLVLSTDLGQQGMMTPPDGVENQIAAVKAAGVSQADIDKMMKKNPAKLLGLKD